MDPILKSAGYTQGSIGERMKALAEGQALPVLRGRQGPRGDPGVHPGAAADHPRAAAARLQHARARQSRSEAAAAGRGTRRAGRVRRRRINRRLDSRQVLDQPAHDRPAQQVQPAGPHASRGDPRPRLAGRVCQQAAADSDPAGVQRLLGRVGPLRRAARRRARGLRRLPGRPSRLPAVDCLPRLPARRRHRVAREALDARAGRCLLRGRERVESGRSGERGGSLLQLAGPGVRLQGGTQRDQSPAGAGADGARTEVRPSSVRRHRRARRQRPARRAREERRRIHRLGASS